MKSSRVLSSSFRGGRLRPSLKVAAIAVASALTLTIGVVEPSAAAPTVTKAKAEKVTSRPDEVSARVTARAQGARVEVESLRNERSATDVSVPGYSGDLALSRSHTSFDGDGTVAGWPSDPATGVFGPGWTASLEGPEAGAAGLQVIDNTRSDGTIVLVDEEGEPLVFQTPTKDRAYKVTVTGSAKSPYLPATIDTTAAAADLTITNSTAAAGASMLMTLKEEDGTVTTWAPVTYSATADTDWVPVSVNEPGQLGSTTDRRDVQVRHVGSTGQRHRPPRRPRDRLHVGRQLHPSRLGQDLRAGRLPAQLQHHSCGDAAGRVGHPGQPGGLWKCGHPGAVQLRGSAVGDRSPGPHL